MLWSSYWRNNIKHLNEGITPKASIVVQQNQVLVAHSYELTYSSKMSSFLVMTLASIFRCSSVLGIQRLRYMSFLRQCDFDFNSNIFHIHISFCHVIRCDAFAWSVHLIFDTFIIVVTKVRDRNLSVSDGQRMFSSTALKTD